MSDFITNAEFRIEAERLCDENEKLQIENAKLREVIDDIIEVVEVSDPALVEFIVRRMQRVGIEVDK